MRRRFPFPGHSSLRSSILSKGGSAVALFCLLFLASCTPAPFSASPLLLPQSFSASGPAELTGQWWREFNDPLLNGLVERAFQGNFTLLAAWSRLAQAEALARKAGAGLRPGLDGEAVPEHERRDDGGSSFSTESLSLRLVAAYELDLWGRLRSQRDAAALDARASREDLQAAAQTLAAQVAGTWYQLVEQREQLDLLKKQSAALERMLALVVQRFRRGQVSAADLLRQRQLVEANQGERALAEAEEQVLVHRLAILLGQPPTGGLGREGAGLADLPSLPATGLPAELIQRRPDLRKAWLAVQAADRRAATALADRFPRFTLSASLGTEGGEGASLFGNWLANLAAGLAAPLLDGGERRAEVERSRAATREALHAYGQAVLTALGEVEDALAREERQQRYVTSLASQLGSAELLYDRVRDHYLHGSLDYLRVLDAVLDKHELERTLLIARRQLLQYRIDLSRALAGGVLPPFPPENFRPDTAHEVSQPLKEGKPPS